MLGVMLFLFKKEKNHIPSPQAHYPYMHPALGHDRAQV